MREYELVIIGGGPAGLAAAVAAHEAGVTDILILERDNELGGILNQCIEPGQVIRFTYDIIHVSMLFSQIIPHSPSATESKRLFYASVSLAVSHTGLSLPSF